MKKFQNSTTSSYSSQCSFYEKKSRYSKYSRISNYSCKLWEREIPKNPNIPDIQEIPLNVLIQTWWNSKYTIYSTYSGNSIYFGTAYEKIPQIPSFQFTVKFKRTKFQELKFKEKIIPKFRLFHYSRGVHLKNGFFKILPYIKPLMTLDKVVSYDWASRNVTAESVVTLRLSQL